MKPASWWMAALGLVAVVVAGCGGDDSSSDSATTASGPTSAEDGDSEEGGDTADGADGTADSGETYATVTVDDETFEFFLDGDVGICNPDLQGTFQVSLYAQGNSEGAPGLQLSIRPDNDGGLPESLLRIGQIWIADPGYTPGTQVDSATIAGNHLEGTATFANAEGTLGFPGTFDVTCAS